MRLDRYLAEYWPEYSRSQWQKYCKDGLVSVSGVVITDPSMKLGEDDAVKVEQPKKQDFSKQTLPVIYENDDVIVIDKPSGVLTHAKGAVSSEFSVAEFVKPKTAYKSYTNRPGIIHRLDRDTSGVIICAKNNEAVKILQRQFSDRKVKKQYIAIIEGVLKENTAMINLPIARNPKAPSTFRVDANGKPAQTKYEVLASDDRCSLIRLQPHTGRIHQLRVHMTHLGHPILGDRVYGKEAKRLMLHAESLEITLPGGKRKIFTSKLPKEFLDYFSNAESLV